MDIDLLSRQVTSPSPQRRISSHCELEPGHSIGQYRVIQQLGRGRFATVWEVEDTDGNRRALKVYRVGSSNRPYYENEVAALNRIFAERRGGGDSAHIRGTGGDDATQGTGAASNLIGWSGFFTHSSIVDGTVRDHPCISFNLAGDHLGRVLRLRKDEGLPPRAVKKFMRDILAGLAQLHGRGFIHTDISMGNLMLRSGTAADAPLDGSAELVIGDLGSACPVDDIFSRTVGTVGYIAPEALLGKKYSEAIDIWSAFVVCYEMITGDPLFDVFGEAAIDYGADVVDDIYSPESDDDASDDSSESDSAPDSNSSGEIDDTHDTNYRYLLLVEKVLGPAPREVTEVARAYYNNRGRLKYNPDIDRRNIAELLYANYDLPMDECRETEEFLLMGLQWLPADRCTAAAALAHPWLAA